MATYTIIAAGHYQSHFHVDTLCNSRILILPPVNMVSTIPFEESLFHGSLQEHGVGPLDHEEIYKYYQHRHYEDAKVSTLTNAPDSIYQILVADADNDRSDHDPVHQWRRSKEPIGKGGQAVVWLWTKQSTSDNADGPIRVAVKDGLLHPFWRDQPIEGILLRKLHDVGCQTVITVYDWLYKEPQWVNEKPIIRIVEEYAEHGDLESVRQFYKNNKLLIPEAFLWHLFWSGANTLCYCRHGTTDSANTIEGWDPIMHMDVKVPNFLMTRPDTSLGELYPRIKMSDFGGAYTLPETGYDGFRQWKSTWRFGTDGFKAPEVDLYIRPKQGSFSPVPPTALHGSHTDIYSLGTTMNWLRSISTEAVRGQDGVQEQHRLAYYSEPLLRLMGWCIENGINERPSAFELFQKTLEGMNRYQRIARKEQAEAPDGWPFHSQVLYTAESRKDFERDRTFRLRYERVNRAPLKNGIKTVDPGEDYTPPVRKSDTRMTPPPPPGGPDEPTAPPGPPGSRKTPPPRSSRETTRSSSKTGSTSHKSSSDSEVRKRRDRPTKPPLEPAHDTEDATKAYGDFMKEYHQQQRNQPPTQGPSNLPSKTPTPPVNLGDDDDDSVNDPAAVVAAPPSQPTVQPKPTPPPSNTASQVETPAEAPAPARPENTAAPRGGKAKPAKQQPPAQPRRGPPRQAKAPKPDTSTPAAATTTTRKPKATAQRVGKAKAKANPKTTATAPKRPGRQPKTKTPKPTATGTRGGRKAKSAPPQQTQTQPAASTAKTAGTKRKAAADDDDDDEPPAGPVTRGRKKARVSVADDDEEGGERGADESEDEHTDVLGGTKVKGKAKAKGGAKGTGKGKGKGKGGGKPKAKGPTKGTTGVWTGRLRKG
ncbi:hypothetical protein XANCAGTX0491_006724 [Xanthoria calcicola]